WISVAAVYGLRRPLSSATAAGGRYLFSIFAECLPLPARDERGEVGEGRSRDSPGDGASSPRPSPPAAEEREHRQQCTAKQTRRPQLPKQKTFRLRKNGE